MNCQSHLYRGLDPKQITRRWFFQQCGVGLGAIALGSLFQQNGWATPADGANPLAPKQPHFPAKAKRVIFLFMAGAPSHLELFDNKPALTKWDGKPPPADLIKDYRAAFINPNAALLGPKFKFARYGQSGAELSELLPHLATVADDIAIVKSMHTDAFNHAPAQILMSTGSQQFGRPEHRRVDDLWPRLRDAGPAGLRGFQHGQQRSKRWRVQLGAGLPALGASRSDVPQRGRSGALSLEPQGRG